MVDITKFAISCLITIYRRLKLNPCGKNTKEYGKECAQQPFKHYYSIRF